MKPTIKIAIDGHSSTGKSTLARQLAADLGYRYIDTGAMYRGVALYALEQGLIRDGKVAAQKLADQLDSIQLNLSYNPKRAATDLWLNGQNVEDQIRTARVAACVSEVAALSAVRQHLVAQQRALAANGGIVMDGRDIGTVVLPAAELKIFMTAQPEIRARRRYEELKNKGQEESLDSVRKNLEKRDELDSTRADSPLRQASDARILDNSQLSPDEQLSLVKKWVRELAPES